MKAKLHWASYDAGFVRGFERAMGLVLGVHPKWTRRDREMRGRVTRRYFGKKRK